MRNLEKEVGERGQAQKVKVVSSALPVRLPISAWDRMLPLETHEQHPQNRSPTATFSALAGRKPRVFYRNSKHLPRESLREESILPLGFIKRLTERQSSLFNPTEWGLKHTECFSCSLGIAPQKLCNTYFLCAQSIISQISTHALTSLWDAGLVSSLGHLAQHRSLRQT